MTELEIVARAMCVAVGQEPDADCFNPFAKTPIPRWRIHEHDARKHIAAFDAIMAHRNKPVIND